MEFTITTDDNTEAKRLAKSLDMASFIFELAKNTRKALSYNEHDDYEEAIWDRIYQMLEEYSIDINDLIE
jgi:hypothetical protein